MASFGVCFVNYDTLVLNDIIQKQKEDNLFNLGIFLSVFSAIGFIIIWSTDLRNVWDAGKNSESIFAFNMSFWFIYASINLVGGAIIAFQLSKKDYVSNIFMTVAAFVFSFVALIQLYTLFTFDFNMASTIMPLFAASGLGQLTNLIFQVLVGNKMTKE